MKNLIRQIDLIGGQPDALLFVHQLEHLGDDFFQFGIHPLQGFRLVPQGWMGIFDDSHDRKLRESIISISIIAGMGGWGERNSGNPTLILRDYRAIP